MSLQDLLPDEAKHQQWFGDKGRLKTERLAEHVLDQLDIITFEDTGDVYVYEEGIYLPRGKPAIKQFLTDELGDRYSTHIRSETIEVIQNKTAKRREEFGMPLDWVCLEDCQVNLRTGEQKQHDPADEYLSKITVPLSPDATCTEFELFLWEHTTDPSKVWTMFAHALHRGYPSHSAFLLWGDTATGKSTTLRILEHILGRENTSATSIRQIRTDNHATANLYGKQANIVSEAPSPKEMQCQEFKSLTGGDPMQANPKFKQPFSFTNSAAMIFACNLSDMPDAGELQELPDEYQRRWEFIRFKNTVPESERVHRYETEFVEDDKELQGIVRKALERANKAFYPE